MKKKKEKVKQRIETSPHQNSEVKALITSICRWLIWVTIFLALLVPLMVKLGSYFPFISYRSLWFMGVVEVMGVAWLFLAIHNPQYRPRPNLVLLTLSLFILSIIISTLLGADPSVSFWSKHERMTGLLMHLHLAAFFLVLVSFMKSEEEWLKLLGLSVGIAVLVSIWGIADNYNINFILELFDFFRIVSIRITEKSQGGSTLGNASFMASYLLINVFLALYLVIRSGAKRWLRILYAGAFILISLGLILNLRGDAARLSLFIGLVLLALLYLAFNYRNQIVNRAAAALLVIGLLAALYIGITAFQEGSFARNQIMQMPGIPGRVANWESSWEGFKERPIFGWGPENFEIALQRHFDPRVMLPAEYGYRAEPWHDRAHNIVFDYLVATGLLGTLLFFSIFAAALYLLWRSHLVDKKIDFWPPAIITTTLAAHFIQNLTVFDMLSSYMLLFVILAYSATVAEGQRLEAVGAGRQGKEKPASQAGDKLPEGTGLKSKLQKLLQKEVKLGLHSYFILLILVFILGLSYNYSVYKPHQGSLYTNQAMSSRPGEAMLEDYQKAIRQSPTGRMQIRRHLSETVTTRLSQLHEMEPEMQEVYFAEADFMINQLHRSIKGSPLNYRPYYSLAELYNAYTQALIRQAAEGMLEKGQEISLQAEDAYRAAIEISPTNPQGYWGLAQALVNQGYLFSDREKMEAALNVLEETVELEPRLRSTHDMGIRVALQLLNDRTLADKWFERAIGIEPAWEETLRSYFPAR